MEQLQQTFQVPLQDKITEQGGQVSRPWQVFFQFVQKLLEPMGLEKVATLVNNQTSVADIIGMSFDYKKVSSVVIEYLVQRVTTGTGATESVGSGAMYLYYKPTSNDWDFVIAPVTAGVTFSVTSAGQVQYTSSNINGTASISRIIWRARTLAGKHPSYSVMGR